MLASSNPQPVSQFNPITGELIMSCANVNFSGIAPVVLDKLTDLEKDKKTPVKKPAGVVEKPNAVVDKAPKHKVPTKQLNYVVVQDKDNVTASAKEPASVVVLDKDNVLVNDPAELDQEKDNEKYKAPAKEPASVVGSVCDVVKQILFDVEDALKNKAIEKASDVVNVYVVVESVCDVVKA
nr:hypothetical protein [Tanacetum cinerariifolium]